MQHTVRAPQQRRQRASADVARLFRGARSMEPNGCNPKMGCAGKWKHGLKPAVPRCFNCPPLASKGNAFREQPTCWMVLKQTPADGEGNGSLDWLSGERESQWPATVPKLRKMGRRAMPNLNPTPSTSFEGSLYKTRPAVITEPRSVRSVEAQSRYKGKQPVNHVLIEDDLEFSENSITSLVCVSAYWRGQSR